MSLSKKLRFEVFKRDGFKCAYCGKAPPSVVLEVDHIEPKSCGGKDLIHNLLTACFDCNRGKKNIPLSLVPSQLQDNIEVLREKEEQLKQYRKFILKIEKRITEDINEIYILYARQYPDWVLADHFVNAPLKRFLSLLPKHEVIDALHIAIAKHPTDHNRVIPYFCGVCWKKIRGEEWPRGRP